MATYGRRLAAASIATSVLLGGLLLISGCSGQSSSQAASPTVPPPINTALPEPTTTPAPTDTPEPTPTATPDIRVYDVDPSKVVLEVDKIPLGGKWWLDDDTPHKNSEILAARGQTEGAQYLEDSGRIGGWIRWVGRGTRQVRVPEWVEFYPVVFKDASGPLWLLEDYGENEGCSGYWEDGDAVRLDREVGFGENSFVCFSREMQPNGTYYVVYQVVIIDRNVWLSVDSLGYENEFDLDAAIELARAQYEKLQEFPLASEVTILP